jgi:nucleotide-binding universal stress UspA family protein
MKAILLPVEPSSVMASVFETAYLLASRFGARVDGIALRPSVIDFIAPDPVVVVLPQPQWNEEEAGKTARSLFDGFVERRGLGKKAGESAATFNWTGAPPIDDAGLGALGRLYDVTVLGRPGVGRTEPRMTTLESALFESGRPIIMAPPAAPASLGTNVLIHWNASTETSRAIAAALRLLKKAERVTVLTVEGAPMQGPKARELLGFLAGHGIRANEITSRASSRPGEAILTEARRLGCDLLVKGAYTQSRLRQMIFGGATSHILQSAELPVLFAH